MKKVTTKSGVKKVMFSGVIASIGRKRGFNGKGDIENRISLKIPALTLEEKEELLDFFEIETIDRFTPKWLKDGSANEEGFDFVNVHTKFDLPIDRMSVVDNFDSINVGAEVDLIIKVKDGAFYPTDIRINKNGEPYNPFEGF